MSGQRKELRVLEKSRVRAAKSTLLFAFAFLVLLAVWQCVERSQMHSGALGMLNDVGSGNLLTEYDSSNVGAVPEFSVEQTGGFMDDPLGIEQEGIKIMQVSEKGNTLWYQSFWSIPQSRILLERALVFQGWEPMDTTQEQIMGFFSRPSATAGGGSLYASFHVTERGCSLLIELI